MIETSLIIYSYLQQQFQLSPGSVRLDGLVPELT